MGNAACAPKPPCSTSTVTTISGRSAGAKHVNHAWSRPDVSAVPVFPPIVSPGNATPRDVPRATDSRINSRASSATSAPQTRLGAASTPGPTCGGAKTPPFATAAVNAATCSGVSSSSPCPNPT